MNTTMLMTKEDYRQAIENESDRRNQAIQEITRLTLANFDQNSIIREANIALDAYRKMRLLKQEMREMYPTTCTCICENHQ